MFPLLTFGVGCLVGAVVLLETHFAPGGNHYPFWALLVVNGSIATAGGAVVAYSAQIAPPGGESSEYVRIRRGDWEQIQLQLLSLRGREAPTGAGWRAGPASERATPPAPTAAAPPRSRAVPAASAPPAPPPAHPAEPSIDSLLFEIETLSLPNPPPPPPRPVGRPSPVTAPPPEPSYREPEPALPAPRGPAPRAHGASVPGAVPTVPTGTTTPRPEFLEDEPSRCARCHREVGTGPFDSVCSICGEPICTECDARVSAEGHPGQCDVCARLVQDLDQ